MYKFLYKYLTVLKNNNNKRESHNLLLYLYKYIYMLVLNKYLETFALKVNNFKCLINFEIQIKIKINSSEILKQTINNKIKAERDVFNS